MEISREDSRLVVYVTAGKTENLSSAQQVFRDAVEQRVSDAGLCSILRLHGSDRVQERYRAIRACHGVIVFVFGQWKATRLNRNPRKPVTLPSEFMHIVASMAVAADRPLLVLREKAVAERGAFRKGYLHPVVDIPTSLAPEWLDSPEFGHEFSKWLERVNQYRHVFLGYSSQASPVGKLIHKYLSEELHLRVFDWHDFLPGDSIWGSIERAERLTDSGIFLFMADDRVTVGKGKHLAPRDNVVYEAGYFAGAKGRSRTLIVREDGAKVPSDLGGILYLALKNRTDISEILPELKRCVQRMLGANRDADV